MEILRGRHWDWQISVEKTWGKKAAWDRLWIGVDCGAKGWNGISSFGWRKHE